MKKDKEKVLDEVWTEERIAQFLTVDAPTGVDRDYHQLLKAYQSMRLNDFATFVDMMREQGRNLAASHNGQCVADIISTHRLGAPYAALLAS